MRLLYICDALALHGGLERVVVEKANWLVDHEGYEVCLLTVNQAGHPLCFPLHRDVLYDDLDIRFFLQYHVPFVRRWAKSRQLHRMFRERLACKLSDFVPDVIICTRLDYLRDLMRINPVAPIVFESHSCRLASRIEGYGLLHRLRLWYLRLAVKRIQMVVALTEGDAAEWRKLTPNVCVIPNIVHLNESGTYSDCHAKSVVFVGRFSWQKDVGSLLRIWTLVHQRHPDWCLHIYGEFGEEQASLLDSIKQMNAQIQVHAPASDIIERYKEHSLLLLTSQYEPFGLVLPEAMSCGLPVVAFDCPYGPADIVTDGIDGFLVQNRNVCDFADKVCQLIDHKELREGMGKNGIKSSRRYEATRIMPLWKDLFERITHQK